MGASSTLNLEPQSQLTPKPKTLLRGSRIFLSGQDGGFEAFMATVDALAMGRKTFETVRDRGFGAFGRFKGQWDVMRVPQILTSSPIMNPVSKSPKWGLWGMR